MTQNNSNFVNIAETYKTDNAEKKEKTEGKGKLTPKMQEKVLKLLIGVGVFIALISIIIIFFFLINLAKIGLPKIPITGTELADFESLSKIFFDQAIQLFDLIITKGFLPIFATILGYLLGEAKATNE